jgi:hypothetical protein
MAEINAASSDPTIIEAPTLEDAVGEKMEEALKRVLFRPVPGAQPFKSGEKTTTKITVVGVGNVGMVGRVLQEGCPF